MHGFRSFSHLSKLRSGYRIKIEVKVVGPIDVVTACVPLVQVYATEINHPEQSRQILDNRKVDYVSRTMLNRAQFDPGWPRSRRTLHEEELTSRAIRITFHDHRPVNQVRQQDCRNVRVVLKQIALGNLRTCPEQFIQIG